MSFFKEVGQTLGIDWAKLALGYQLINYNGEALYIEGVKKIRLISDTEIVLDVGKNSLTVSGEGLTIFDVSGQSVMIKGKIISAGLPNNNMGERL